MYKTHTLSGSSDIQATRNKHRCREGGYYDSNVYLDIVLNAFCASFHLFLQTFQRRTYTDVWNYAETNPEVRWVDDWIGDRCPAEQV